jgi:hypothetical protein
MNRRPGESEVRLDVEVKINPCLARIQGHYATSRKVAGSIPDEVDFFN